MIQQKLNTNEPFSKKILLVDDQVSNLVIIKNQLEKNLADYNLGCDVALGGREAISIIKKKLDELKNSYDLILMDIQMPDIDGIEVNKQIRTFNQEIPILAFSSLDISAINSATIKRGVIFEDSINKSSPLPKICRSIIKWIFDKDNFFYLKNQKQLDYPNYKIIFADTKKAKKDISGYISSFGINVSKVFDVNDLVRLYKESFDQKIKSSFDLIIIDNDFSENIEKVIKEIREIDYKNLVTKFYQIPIIIIVNQINKEKIRKLAFCQIDDYFLESDDVENLLKLITVYLDSGSDKKRIIDKNQISDQLRKSIKSNVLPVINTKKIDFFNQNEKLELVRAYNSDSLKIIEYINYIKNSQFDLVEKIDRISLQIHALKGITESIGGEIFSDFIRLVEKDFKSGNFPQNQNWLEEIKKLHNHLIKELFKIVNCSS